MADDASAYTYVLLAEFDANIKIPKLKNKLVKYFQSRKQSNGGDCQVEYDETRSTAEIRFRTEEDKQKVLGKGAHEIRLDQRVLKITVRVPGDERERSPKQKAPAADNKKSADTAVPKKQVDEGQASPADSGDDQRDDGEELCSTSAVIGNIPQDVGKEFLEMLVENVLKHSKSSAPSLEILPEKSSAVVTFQSGKENTDFITNCSRNRIFQKKALSVCPLEVTAKVTVEDLPDVSSDFLALYFDKDGLEIQNVTFNKEEQFAIITFKTPRAVSKLIEKKHIIKQQAVKVYPFYDSLGTALYGKDRPTLKLPAAFTESIDLSIWKYLNNHKAAETLQSELAKHFCEVDLQEPPSVRLRPLPSLLKRKDVKAKDIREWSHAAKMAFEQALSRFKALKLQLQPMAWKESEEKIREAVLNEAVEVVPDEGRGVLAVVGLLDDVNRLEQPLKEILDSTAKRVFREKFSNTEKITLRPSIFHILSQDGLQDKLLDQYPELKVTYNVKSQELSLYGLTDEVLGASTLVMQENLALKRMVLNLDQSVLEFLKDEDQENLTSSLFTSNGINAVLEVGAKTSHLLAVSDRNLSEAERQLKMVLVSQCITVEDMKVLQMPQWQEMVTHLDSKTNRPSRKILIQTPGSHSAQVVAVSGYKDSVLPVHSKLQDFLHQNAEVEETITVNHDIIARYIKEHGKKAWSEQVKDRVVVSFRNKAISLRGSRCNVLDCKPLIEDFVSSLCIDTLTYTEPGVKKFFQEKETMYVSSVINETGCLVQMVDQPMDMTSQLTGAGGQDLSHGRVPNSTYQVETTGVEIAVCKADMCSYPVSAVINSTNQDLKLIGGLSGALLVAAGPQLQEECDRLITQNGQLKRGQCVMTGAGGSLKCKNIIHAVGPGFDQNSHDQASHDRSLGLLKKTIKKSLELAEEHGCTSVALPAIGVNSGFPLNLCADTIVKAVKEHCQDGYGTLKKIHLVNKDDKVVLAMETAVRKEFGNHGVSHSQQKHPTKTLGALSHNQPKHPSTPTKTPGVQRVQSTNNSDEVVTNEGLIIMLTKGNIQDATTDVVVNTVGENLALDQGAVSNAILGAAGQNLQALVHDQKSSGKPGDVIVTDGCNLKSSKVFHAVAPRWDNGQGNAEKMLEGILEDCLSKTESSGLTSITFPAIGTGNLGFPKDLVASVLLSEFMQFSSSRQPKHLKKIVVILHPSDASTIQAFDDEFKNRFTHSGSSQPTTHRTGGPFSKVISSSGMHETRMGRVDIQVVTGDITKETTDVIVNSSNESFTLKSGVSKAILEAAGQIVEDECKDLGAQGKKGMIMTQPGNLKCKKILHLVGQSDPVRVNTAVKAALEMCIKNSYTSVSFPALGTGQGNTPATQVADAMLDAVVDVLSQSGQNPLKTIRIVVFQPKMLKDFHSSMQKKEGADQKGSGTHQRASGTHQRDSGTHQRDSGTHQQAKVPSTWSWSNLVSTVKGTVKAFFVGGSASSPQKEEDFVIEEPDVERVYFHICGESRAKVDSAKKWVSELISQEQVVQTIADNFVLCLSDRDHQRIIEMQSTMAVGVKIERKKGAASLTIKGRSKDVVKATGEIQEMMTRAREKEALMRAVELAGTKADWQYKAGQGLQFQSFDPNNNFTLEQALTDKHPFVEVTVKGQLYTVTMPNGPATTKQGTSLEIMRIDKLNDANNLPQHWDAMPANTPCLTITVQPGSPEHNEILTLFNGSCTGRTVIKIERIQNRTLWKSIQIKKQDMDLRNGHTNNEKRLFHGTCPTTIDHISNRGFNRSYAGMNAACYGNGTYFAVRADYSAQDTYSKPDAQGQKHMYVCRVLTGDYTLGRQNMVVPPAKTPNGTVLYDSVVNNMQSPAMFIIFHDSMAYPEYLITFT